MKRFYYTFICTDTEGQARVQTHGELDDSRQPTYANSPPNTKLVVKGYEKPLSAHEKKAILRELCAMYYTSANKFFGDRIAQKRIRDMYLRSLEESYEAYIPVIKSGAHGKIWGKRVLKIDYNVTMWIIREFQLHEDFTPEMAVPIEALALAHENLQGYLARHGGKYPHPSVDGEGKYETKVQKDIVDADGEVTTPVTQPTKKK